ncbi:MAG: endolytic transglycosylase MltG [Firmicutes bacterium]|nr:endolytic transglycosylase MltG [Bacillota bacterium]
MDIKKLLEDLTNSKQKKMIAAVVAALIIILVCGLIFYFSGIGAADKGNHEEVIVDIPNGTGGSQIIEILDEQGFIKNKFCAKVHMKLGGYNSLQANSYVFTKNMSLQEIMDAINTGDFNYLSKNAITIIEGSTVPMAAEAIAEKMPFTKEEILNKWSDTAYLNTLIDEYWFLTDEILQSGIMFPLEGYIYPETYFVTDKEPTIESITVMFLDKANEELTARKAKIDEYGMSVHELLSLASVVQNESLFEEDIPKIAGVFVNRLEEGMPLQSDITVLYALQEKRVDVTYADLEVDSPYNTYKYAGIPIGPVCGVAGYALDATLDYEESNYLYFFATKDGKVLYSKTLAEHEKTVNENLWY